MNMSEFTPGLVLPFFYKPGWNFMQIYQWNSVFNFDSSTLKCVELLRSNCLKEKIHEKASKSLNSLVAHGSLSRVRYLIVQLKIFGRLNVSSFFFCAAMVNFSMLRAFFILILIAYTIIWQPYRIKI